MWAMSYRKATITFHAVTLLRVKNGQNFEQEDALPETVMLRYDINYKIYQKNLNLICVMHVMG